MRINIIAALGNSFQIGKENKLLWHISEDLKNFKKLTLNKTIVMGRKTFESIGRPLPGRRNIVISRSDFSHSGVEVFKSFDEILSLNIEEEIFVIGGGEIYQLALPYAQKLYLSFVDYDGEADTFFPQVDLSLWNLILEEKFEVQTNSPGWIFRIYALSSTVL